MSERLNNSEKKKVLVVEDSSAIQTLAKSILEFQKYNVYSARNGNEALALFSKNEYDIILMDINMPEMDGMSCVKEIRAMKDKKKSEIPIIAITGNAEGYTLEEFTKTGFNDCFEKPINFDELLISMDRSIR